MSSTPETPALAKPDVMLRVPVGLASPLWGFFAGAAVGGAAFWWMTRWANPQNLEAMFGQAAPAETPVEVLVEAPVEAPVEVIVEPVVDEPEAVAFEAPEPVLEAAPEPVAEPIVEVAPEAPPEPVVDSEPPVVALAEAEAVAEAPVLAAKPRVKKAAAKAD